MSQVYDKAVQRTFSDSLRSVFLVDDAFPTFSDMFKSAKAQQRFKERDRAARMYRAFRGRQLPCDIENTFRANDLKMVDRLRKCDLIVLDFHLDADDTNSDKSIEILRRLADSPHFNTVVVYTKADLEEVWLDIAANLRPDLRVGGILESNPVEAAWWEGIDSDVLQRPTDAAISKFLTNDPKAARTEVIPDIIAHGGPAAGNHSVKAEIWLRSNVGRRRNASVRQLDDADRLGARTLQGRFEDGKPLWLQCRGCFIAIVKKSNDEVDEVAVLLQQLNEALLDWRPSFLQLLVSEIQNKLELELFAADPEVFSDSYRQVGLSHYLLQELTGDEDQESTVESLIDRIVETLRNRISGDGDLRKFANNVLSDIRQDLGAKITSADKMENARALAHVGGTIQPDKVLFLLNSFLSTEKVSRSRVTTGTIFKRDDDYWIVATPACDLTARTPGAAQLWMKNIHPVRAMMAVRLRSVSIPQALQVATQGRHAFVQLGDEQLALTFQDTQTATPDPEMFFTMNAGKVLFRKGRLPSFKASRVLRAASQSAPKMAAAEEFLVVGQLRANYASRVLQITGAHLARIGIDFFNVGEA